MLSKLFNVLYLQLKIEIPIQDTTLENNQTYKKIPFFFGKSVVAIKAARSSLKSSNYSFVLAFGGII